MFKCISYKYAENIFVMLRLNDKKKWLSHNWHSAFFQIFLNSVIRVPVDFFLNGLVTNFRTKELKHFLVTKYLQNITSKTI